MDVRCEKCQTEYELDEARLKPGGVTVKCTNCGHMFKIRKRTPTNVGVPSGQDDEQRTRPATPARPMPAPRADSVLDVPRATSDTGSGPTAERQWLIRLENGEQKSCRELAVLQQWIVSGVVTRESLISRTGKTWKRLGDVAELGQYFVIADEARTTRAQRVTPGKPAGTMLGVGTTKAAGGTILPDDDEKPTHAYGRPPRTATPPPPPPLRTPPMGSPITKPPPTPAMGMGVAKPVATANTEVMPPTVPARRPITQPPPPPQPQRKTMLSPGQAFPQAAGNRSTATWATDGIKPADPSDGDGPSFGGRVAAITDEPAFAAGPGRVRPGPADERGFETGKVKYVDDDDGDGDLFPGRGRGRGSRAGTWIVIVALLVMGAAAGVIYMVINKQGGKKDDVAKPTSTVDAAVASTAKPDAQTSVTPIVDAAVAQDPLEVARAELGKDDESRIKAALPTLEGKDEPAAQALRAHLGAALAQDMLDRSNLIGDKAEAEKLRKEQKTVVLEAAPFAQRALKAKPDDAAANLAMAEVLRLQGKPARDVKRYLDAARAKADKDLAREVSLAEALLLARDAKLDDAKSAFVALDSGDGKLEQSGDVRARYHIALLAYLQGKPTDAKPLVDQILAARPEHAGARALAARLDTTVANTDPLPPEDHKDAGVPHHGPDVPVASGAGMDYDKLVAQANGAATSNCSRAMDIYAKALEVKANGVEALTGMGYCHIDRKEFASAHSKFRAALAVSSRYEPALFGIAEAYAQQGRKEDAINSFKAYLEIYPSSAKAKRQLEILGVTGDAPPPQGSGGSAAPPPTPPAPPPAGSGGSAAETPTN